VTKKRITIETLAGMVKRGFDDVGRQFSDAIEGLREEMATKEDLRHFATKEDLKDFATKADMKASEVRILQAVDKIATAFDRAEKDQAADKLLHDRHERRLEKLEVKVGLKSTK
jgi:hypothetical protein